MAELQIRLPSGDRLLKGPGPFRVGRDPACDLVLDDERVSRVHGSIGLEAGVWVYRDLGSRNGSFVGGRRVDHVELGTSGVCLGRADGPAVMLAADTVLAGIGAETALGTMTSIIRPAARMTIGRAADNLLVIDDLSVSRHHALLEWAEGRLVLTDLRSFNGTYVNGQAIERRTLAEGDVVTVGHRLLRVSGRQLVMFDDTSPAAFAAEDLEVVTAGGSRLLAGVSFAIPPGSLTAIVGPSGAGKSTLLNVLTGRRRPTTGRVTYRGRDVHGHADIIRQRIGLVPQDDTLPHQLPLGATLGFAASLRFPPDVSRAERRERVDTVMQSLGIDHRAALRVGQLSGGQRKRASVAIELLTRPTLLFLDEPTSGLDPGLERSVMLQLKALAGEGQTVVVVTHTTESLGLCDRVLFLAGGGSTAFFGPPHTALQYFGAAGYAEVFSRLDAERDSDWPGRFRASVDYRTYVEKPLAQQTEPIPGAHEDTVLQQVRRRSAFRQFLTLTRRYFATLRADGRFWIASALQAGILGLLLLIALLPGQLGGPRPLEASFAQVVIVALVLGVTWIGIANSIREVVKEQALYRRERSAGLSPFAYLASKMLVLSLLTAAQAAIVGVIAVQRQDGPESGAVLASGLAELLIGLMLTGLAAMSLGLLVSTMVSKQERTMTIFPLILVIQLLFVGLFPSIEQAPVIGELRNVASAQWGFAAVASTVDLNHLVRYNDVSDEMQQELRDNSLDLRDLPLLVAGEPGDTPQWAHNTNTWVKNITALGGLYLAAFLLAWVTLRVRDRRNLRAS